MYIWRYTNRTADEKGVFYLLKQFKKGIYKILIVIILTGISCYAIVISQAQDNRIPEQQPMIKPQIETGYIPLPDVKGEQIVEHIQNDNSIVINGKLYQKTRGYKKVADSFVESENADIFIDRNDNFIVINEIRREDQFSGILISKYDQAGKKLLTKTYGEDIFNYIYGIEYNDEMGIVISGDIQFDNQDDQNMPGIVCIDTKRLEMRWSYPLYGSNSVLAVTDYAVYGIESVPGTGRKDKELMLAVVKLNHNGEEVWKSVPLAQWIEGIAQLADGRVVVVQRLADKEEIQIICFDSTGTELLKIASDCYGEVTATDDGGFILTAIRNIKTVPQPAYISSIWYDTETVAVKYNHELKVQWRKTYDKIKDKVGIDLVIPCRDGSLVVP